MGPHFPGGCSAPGDCVDDTPAVASSDYMAVHLAKIHVLLLYDNCMNTSTSGQIERITAMYESYIEASMLTMHPAIFQVIHLARDYATKTTKHEVKTFAGDCATPVNTTTPRDDDEHDTSMFIDTELTIDIDAIIANDIIYTLVMRPLVLLCFVWKLPSKWFQQGNCTRYLVHCVYECRRRVLIDDLDIVYEGEVDVYHCNTDTFEEITPGPPGPADELKVCVWNLASFVMFKRAPILLL